MLPKHMFRNDYGKGIGLIETLVVIAVGDFENASIFPCGQSTTFLGPCDTHASFGWTGNPVFFFVIRDPGS
jgi:hypothetical protein